MHEDSLVALSILKKLEKIKDGRIGELLSTKWYIHIMEDSIDIKKDEYKGYEAT